MMSTEQDGKIKILAVDDDARILRLMDAQLSSMGYEVRCVDSGEAAIELFSEEPIDIVLLDIDMPGMSGLEVLKQVKSISSSCEVVIITGNANKESAIEALRLGAFDFFEKPANFDEIDQTLKRTARFQAVVRERDQLSRKVDDMVKTAGEEWNIDGFIGDSRPARDLKDSVRKLQSNDKINVLLIGESGTGKELVARAIHYGGLRAKGPFIAMNCAAIPEQLAESRLFGHVKGAFTGAARDKKGCFELADRGTLFLDEIGDMIPEVQSKLLRVLEDGVFVPVGATRERKVDVRIVAATNCNLRENVEQGAFRRDLYYRLERFMIELPPLRERREDIPALVDYFAARFAEEMGRKVPRYDASFIDCLKSLDFPGNVRELRNLVERAVIESGPSDRMTSDLLPASSSIKSEFGMDIPMNLSEAQVCLARRAVEKTDGNMTEAARLLGINRSKLYRLLG